MSYVVFGSETALLSIDENTTAVVDIDATDDIDSEGSGLTYGVSGTDSALFSIDSSGNLSFLSAPDFETPLDANADNDYEVTVTVTDSSGVGGGLSDMLDLIVTVDDVGGG